MQLGKSLVGLHRSNERLILFGMTLRLLSAILTALTLFFAPLGMSSDGGMAMAHARVETADVAGHCAGSEQPSDSDQRSDMQMGCMSACAAVPAIQPAALAPAVPEPATTEAFHPRMLIGTCPESETPPPRYS